jgi:hypothetical protein
MEKSVTFGFKGKVTLTKVTLQVTLFPEIG